MQASKRLFEINHLRECGKLEPVARRSPSIKLPDCSGVARTGSRKDGIIAVHDVEAVLRIRDQVP